MMMMVISILSSLDFTHESLVLICRSVAAPLFTPTSLPLLRDRWRSDPSSQRLTPDSFTFLLFFLFRWWCVFGTKSASETTPQEKKESLPTSLDPWIFKKRWSDYDLCLLFLKQQDKRMPSSLDKLPWLRLFCLVVTFSWMHSLCGIIRFRFWILSFALQSPFLLFIFVQDMYAFYEDNLTLKFWHDRLPSSFLLIISITLSS